MTNQTHSSLLQRSAFGGRINTGIPSVVPKYLKLNESENKVDLKSLNKYELENFKRE